MRRIALILLIVSTLLFAACSYINNFVIVNASDQPVEVRYKDMEITSPDRAPLIKLSSQIHEQIAWQQLPSSRYKIDPENREVVLTLNPGEALLLEQCRPANGETEGNCETGDFLVEKIALIGAKGEINLRGDQVQRSFVAESKHTYTLTYK
jgi:hypothetical protein